MGLDKNFAVGRYAVLKSQNHDAIVGACHEILEVKGNMGLIQVSDGGRKYWLSNELIVAVVDTMEKYNEIRDLDVMYYNRIKGARKERLEAFMAL